MILRPFFGRLARLRAWYAEVPPLHFEDFEAFPLRSPAESHPGLLDNGTEIDARLANVMMMMVWACPWQPTDTRPEIRESHLHTLCGVRRDAGDGGDLLLLRTDGVVAIIRAGQAVRPGETMQEILLDWDRCDGGDVDTHLLQTFGARVLLSFLVASLSDLLLPACRGRPLAERMSALAGQLEVLAGELPT